MSRTRRWLPTDPISGWPSGWLFAATAAGAVAGEVLVGRFVPPAQRDRFIGPLRLLLGLPPAAAMGTMAAASTAVTLLLVPGLRRSAPARPGR